MPEYYSKSGEVTIWTRTMQRHVNRPEEVRIVKAEGIFNLDNTIILGQSS